MNSITYLPCTAPGGVSDGAVVVHPERGRLGVVGGGPQSLGLVYEHVWHPEPETSHKWNEYSLLIGQMAQYSLLINWFRWLNTPF